MRCQVNYAEPGCHHTIHKPKVKLTDHYKVTCNGVTAIATYSAILLPSSLLDGLELAVKMIRPPFVAFIVNGFLALTPRDSDSGSLGSQALLSPA